MRFIIVDFPAPVAPTKAIVSPAFISKLTFSNTFSLSLSYAKVAFSNFTFPSIGGNSLAPFSSWISGSVSNTSKILSAPAIFVVIWL